MEHNFENLGDVYRHELETIAAYSQFIVNDSIQTSKGSDWFKILWTCDNSVTIIRGKVNETGLVELSCVEYDADEKTESYTTEFQL